jgi:hypothetical protein
VPDLIIFSDMQFDAACCDTYDDDNAYGSGVHRYGSQRRSGPATQLHRIQKRFHDVGVEVCGSPYPAPRIVFWNLRGDYGEGCPAAAHDDNVQLLSGFSPSMLEEALSASPIEAEKQGAERGVVTPYQTLRKVLDSDKYDCVRDVLVRCGEGVLSHYSTPSKQHPY